MQQSFNLGNNAQNGRVKNGTLSSISATDGNKLRAKSIFAVVCLVLFAASVLLFYKVIIPNDDKFVPEAPAAEIMNACFSSAKAPSTSDLKYVHAGDLTGPAIENVVANKVVSDGSFFSSGFVCEVKADVTFKNEYIQATTQMKANCTYSQATGTWTAGDPQSVLTNYTPTSGPDIEQIKDDLMDKLKEYDEDSAKECEDAAIESAGELTDQGGTVVFTLTKQGAGVDITNKSTAEAQEDYLSGESDTNNEDDDESGAAGSKADLVKTVEMRVVWNTNQGWQANITRVKTSGASNNGKPNQRPQTDEGDNTDENGLGQATMQLSCSTGTLIQISGTVEGTTLKADYVLKLTVDGNVYTVRDFVIAGNTSKYSGHADVVGRVSVSGSSVVITVS